jgi:hypothetical protein
MAGIMCLVRLAKIARDPKDKHSTVVIGYVDEGTVVPERYLDSYMKAHCDRRHKFVAESMEQPFVGEDDIIFPLPMRIVREGSAAIKAFNEAQAKANAKPAADAAAAAKQAAEIDELKTAMAELMAELAELKKGQTERAERRSAKASSAKEQPSSKEPAKESEPAAADRPSDAPPAPKANG